MNKRVKQLWLKALRSNKYRQTQGWLRSPNDKDARYCCLGVLCEIYRQKEGGEWQGEGFQSVNGSYSSAILPQAVTDWAELDRSDPKLGRTLTASSLNDKGKSFSFIANRIEKYL